MFFKVNMLHFIIVSDIVYFKRPVGIEELFKLGTTRSGTSKQYYLTTDIV